MNDLGTYIEKETISFYPSEYSTTKTIKIKYTLSGSSFKLQLPVFNQGNAEEFLHFLHEFVAAKEKHGYNTCAKLESGLEQLLQGNACNEWNTIKNTVSPNSQTVNVFNERVSAFKRINVPIPLAIDIQRNYSQRIKKNDKLTVPQFLDWLKHINMLIAQFPSSSNQNIFTTDELKKIIYHSMPVRWRTNFVNSSQNVQQPNFYAPTWCNKKHK